MTTLISKKPRINSKSKGSGFELSVCKILSKEFSPLCFKRTQGSGAVVGGFNGKNTIGYSSAMLSAFVGDIFPSNEDDVAKAEGWSWKRTIECKFYKSADSFQSLFKKPQVVGWFEQALTDAAKLPNKRALLLFKFNHTPIYFAVEESDSLPNNISTSIKLEYNATINGELLKRSMIIGLFDEALTDKDWWKAYEPKTR